MTSKIDYVTDGLPVTTGCTKVSAACYNCYAARLAATRLKHHPRYEGLAYLDADGRAQWTGEVRRHYDVLATAYRWRKPRTVFVSQTSDLFHEQVSKAFRKAVLTTAADLPQHTFVFLTKRPQRMYNTLVWFRRTPENCWFGTTCEIQDTWDDRVLWLVALKKLYPVHIWVSVEPLLSSIDTRKHLGKIDGVIVGGESGRDARPTHRDWVRKYGTIVTY